ncbi:MAG: AgmX/PglI C-terminal domain-containing protein [Bdellovibrionaceae bacterium]|nr:AgmX/PglI C-terminal domain-containing protein [Pseudobdellovibrionaceae bacterium]
MEKRLVLEDNNGTVLRSYQWQGESVEVIRRSDTRRLEVVPSSDFLTKKKIPFESMGFINAKDLQKKPFLVGELGHLRMVETVGTVDKNLVSENEGEKRWYWILAAVMLASTLIMSYIRTMPLMTPKIEQSLKQEVIKITKSIPPRQKVETKMMANTPQETAATKTVTKTTNTLKRMGALSALGSLSNSKQKGGLDLGAVNTTAGPGLGGTQGSGGVQISLYAKGIASAPLGAGGNLQGAGGYGTKGKGGGRAGYGKLSLVGSAGTSPIALAQEATVETGLDRDQIAAVINKNLGQVRFCYEQGLQAEPSLNGRVAVAFTIGGNGLVKSAGIDSSSMNSKIIEDCIMMRLKTWQFPLPQGGVDVKVSYPFVLRRAGQG